MGTGTDTEIKCYTIRSTNEHYGNLGEGILRMIAALADVGKWMKMKQESYRQGTDHEESCVLN